MRKVYELIEQPSFMVQKKKIIKHTNKKQTNKKTKQQKKKTKKKQKTTTTKKKKKKKTKKKKQQQQKTTTTNKQKQQLINMWSWVGKNTSQKAWKINEWVNDMQKWSDWKRECYYTTYPWYNKTDFPFQLVMVFCVNVPLTTSSWRRNLGL